MAIDRNQAPGGAGQEDRTEQVVLTIPRSRLEEIRVMRVIDAGRPSLLIRQWIVDPTGLWIPGKRGISIRAKELGPVTEALRQGIPWAYDVWAEHKRQVQP